MSNEDSVGSRRSWPDYRTVWRWHFYAGMFCIPFVLVLSITGTIYLFKPQIESWEERRFDQLVSPGEPQPLRQQIDAATASLPGGLFEALELPQREGQLSATRVLVRSQSETQRVFVDPVTLGVLGSLREKGRIANVAKELHGELLLGKRGSYLVELAASWTLIMVVTGIVLWWPRSGGRIAGVVYPRITKSGRTFWRDVHSVGGVWVSALVVFLIVTGLPWATFWGDYFKGIRQMTGTAVAQQSWEGGHGEHSGHVQQDHSQATPSGDHAAHDRSRSAGKNKDGKANGHGPSWKKGPVDPSAYLLSEIDRAVPLAMQLGMAHPVLVRPVANVAATWEVDSITPNRPLRQTWHINLASGEQRVTSNFADRHWVDRMVSQGIALHEGQRFGIANQLLALMATTGLVMLSGSGMVMWWRRRKPGSLGIPKRFAWHDERVSSPRLVGLLAIIATLAGALPLFGASLVMVLVLDRLFQRLKRV